MFGPEHRQRRLAAVRRGVGVQMELELVTREFAN
jgi:hypothetical protein